MPGSLGDPVRLSPVQNIVEVGWPNAPVIVNFDVWLAVEKGPDTQPSPTPPNENIPPATNDTIASLGWAIDATNTYALDVGVARLKLLSSASLALDGQPGVSKWNPATSTWDGISTDPDTAPVWAEVLNYDSATADFIHDTSGGFISIEHGTTEIINGDPAFDDPDVTDMQNTHGDQWQAFIGSTIYPALAPPAGSVGDFKNVTAATLNINGGEVVAGPQWVYVPSGPPVHFAVWYTYWQHNPQTLAVAKQYNFPTLQVVLHYTNGTTPDQTYTIQGGALNESSGGVQWILDK